MQKITRTLLFIVLFLTITSCEINTNINNDSSPNTNTGNNNIENKDENTTPNEDIEEDVEKPHRYTHVDLGLPSGTKWGTTNLGAKTPEEIGDYYAWGEVVSKKDFTKDNYMWYSGDSIIKYCNDTRKCVFDNKLILEPADDAATVNIGSNWHIPTKEQMEELKRECNWVYTQRGATNGVLFTSKVNENSIFIPASGYYGDYNKMEGETHVVCWASNMKRYYDYQAYAFYIGPNNFDIHALGFKHFGFTIRPVFNE